MADQPIRVASGQAYGVAKAQADAQRVAPLPEMPVVPLNAPTMRPSEHVMSGVNAGPGPSAAEAGVIGAEQDGDHILNTLRGLYQQYPLPGIAAAISDYAQHPPWSFDDLTIDLVDEATLAAQRAERNRRFDELAGIGKSRIPNRVGRPRPDLGDKLRNGWSEDSSNYRQNETDLGDKLRNGWSEDSSDYNQDLAPAAGIAAGVAGMAPPVTDEGNTTTTADQPLLKMKGPR